MTRAPKKEQIPDPIDNSEYYKRNVLVISSF